jgi:hypothetical protein
MSNSDAGVKDLIGQKTHMEFFVPVDDNAQFQYQARFGIGTDRAVDDSFIVKAPPGTPIKLYAAFKGQLYLNPSLSGDPDDNLMMLRIMPTEALLLSTLLPLSESSPANITYYHVDLIETKKAINKVLTDQGLASTLQSNTLTEFINGEVGVFVQAGQWIGAAFKETTSICFEDTDGYMLHPYYLLWLLWKSANNKLVTFMPSSHSLVKAMQLPSSNFVLKDGIVTLPDLSQEPFCLAFP